MTQEELKEKRERFRLYGEICLMMEEQDEDIFDLVTVSRCDMPLEHEIVVRIENGDSGDFLGIQFEDGMLWVMFGTEQIAFLCVSSESLKEIYEALKNFFKDGEKQGGQKHIEDRYMEGHLNGINDELKTLKSVVWSEEDEYHKRQILRILKDNGCSRKLQEKTEKWIEERLKSLRPQSQWKPSEEYKEAVQLIWDEKLIPFKDGNQWCFLLGYNIQEGVCGFGDSILEAALEFYKDYTTTRECIGELSRPQSYFSLWEPSDEQMKAIEFMVRSFGESGTLSPYGETMAYATSLLNDLKKLREE